MTGVRKELRMLAWPAAAVLAANLAPLLWLVMPLPGRPVSAALFAFILGSALLAALPFGAEFHQRTLGLVLSQPAARARIWFEKWSALLAVLVVLVGIQLVALQSAPPDARVEIRAATVLAALVCSGFFWTLVAGSTIGGAVFSLAALALVEMVSSLIASRVTGLEIDPMGAHPALIAVRLVYAAAALWLGWRMFLHYELKATGEIHGVLPAAVLDAVPALRSRPVGAIGNLVRKELRLQQPTMLIAALFVLCWLTAMLVFSMPSMRPAVAEIVFTTLFVSYVPLVLIVCGTISIGEDTSLGIRAWHLTLPVASATQWGVKLAAAVVIGAALGVALPLILKLAALAVVPLPAGSIQLPPPAIIAMTAGALLVMSFWAAALFGHTIKAAVATAVIVPLLWAAIILVSEAAWGTGLGSGWLTSLMVAKQWSPEDLQIGLTNRAFTRSIAWAAVVALGLLALRQSLIAFRTSQVERSRVVRNALQLALVGVLVSFIPSAYVAAARDQYRSQPVRELEAALKQISAAALADRGEIPAAVTGAGLEATGLLSEHSRRWLAGSRIQLESSAPRSTRAGQVRYVQIEVTLQSGSTFRMLYTVP